MKNRVWGNKIPAAVMAFALGTSISAALVGTAMAQEVIFTGEPAPFTVYQTYQNAFDGSDAYMDITVDSLHVLGGISASDDSVLYAAVLLPNVDAEAADTGEMPWITGFVLASEIMEKIPAISCAELPSAAGWTDLGQGSSGDFVIDVQTNLIELGLLNGAADGRYGPGTASAISVFQQESGLPATGVLDVMTYFYLEESVGGLEPLESAYPPVFTMEDKFYDIIDDVENSSVLDSFLTPGWIYTYDAFEGEGLITEGTVLGTYEDSSRPVDTISMTVSPAVKVKREDTGLISVYPILQVKSIGAYRPYVKNIILKAGNAVCDLEDAVLSGKLTGTQVEEIAEVPVSTEDLKALEGDMDKTLEVRVKGNSRTYDLEVTAGVQELVALVNHMQ